MQTFLSNDGGTNTTLDCMDKSSSSVAATDNENEIEIKSNEIKS